MSKLRVLLKVKTDRKQGECLIFLTDELEEADLFDSEEQILSFLQNENYKYDDIKFVERVETKNVKYSIIK